MPVLKQVTPDIKQIGLDKMTTTSTSIHPSHSQNHSHNTMTRQGLGMAQGQGLAPGEGEDDNSSVASGQTLESSVLLGAGGEGSDYVESGEAGVGVGVGGVGGEKKEEKHDTHKPPAAAITAAMRETLRVKLGSLVHRKLSAILPDVFTLAGDPPRARYNITPGLCISLLVLSLLICCVHPLLVY